jgi:hypothetical protein
MSLAEAIETTCIHSVAGLTGARTALVTMRPCRAPPQTISDVGLIGGGPLPRPGEGPRAHHGVHFLDELPECRRHVLEVLRQPLEDGVLYRQSPARSEPPDFGGVRQPGEDGEGVRQRTVAVHHHVTGTRSQPSPLLIRSSVCSRLVLFA